MTRPICVHCSTPYGRRETTETALVWRKGEQRPAYQINGVVLKYRQHGPLHVLEHALGRPKESDDDYIFLDVWDGESWIGGYEPFCTLRCALDYARQAYAHIKTGSLTFRTAKRASK